MISVLIPAYNEAERIVKTIAAVKRLPHTLEIIVVDDGSTDDTADRAKAAEATKVITQANGGKGKALTTAFAASTGDIILLLDADLGDSAEEAQKLLKPILAGQADMTIALFPRDPKAKPGGMGFVVRRAQVGIFRLTRHTMKAPLSGQRALRRAVIERGGGFADGWGVEVGLTIKALRNGYRVEEIPTEMRHRVTGRSLASVWHRYRQYREIGRVLSRLQQKGNP